MSSKVVDDWTTYASPMLAAIVNRAENANAYLQLLSDDVLNEVVTSANADERYKYERALVRLAESGYIEVINVLWGKPYPMHITGVTERGLRAVGAWPSPDSVVDALLDQLEKQANDIAVSQPEKSKRLTDAVGFLATGARDVLVGVVTGIAKQAAGLP